jgi:hypothetical protein
MDEEMEYAEMLEIPVSTVNVTKKRGRKPKKQSGLKEKVITKVNEQSEPITQGTPSLEAQPKPQSEEMQAIPSESFENSSTPNDDPILPEEKVESAVIGESTPIPIPRRKKRPFLARLFGGRENEWEYESSPQPAEPDPFASDEYDQEELPIYNYSLWQDNQKSARSRREKRNAWIVGIEFAACVALCTGIFLTNVLYPNSAINTFFKTLGQSQQTDVRTYADFTLSSILSEEDATLNLSPTGILSFTEEGCVYPAVDGSVTEVSQNADGTWTVKISHSPTFSEIITGLSYAACSVGSTVKSNVPVGYSDGTKEVQLSMYEDGALLNCFYLTENGNLAWTED